MKNIVYYAFDEHYLECFKYNLKILRRNNPSIHVCCITPVKFDLDVEFFIPEHFDVRHTAKYEIVNWEHFEEYDNFLYLDSDAISIKSLETIFNEINENKNLIHGVKEQNEMINADHPFFRVFGDIPAEGPVYNAGTFGFNKKQKFAIKELLAFKERVKPITICEQPCFNEFFACQKNILTPSLSKYVYLQGIVNENKYYQVNKITLEESSVIHLLGNFSCPPKPKPMAKKIEKILQYLRTGTTTSHIQRQPCVNKIIALQ